MYMYNEKQLQYTDIVSESIRGYPRPRQDSIVVDYVVSLGLSPSLGPKCKDG